MIGLSTGCDDLVGRAPRPAADPPVGPLGRPYPPQVWLPQCCPMGFQCGWREIFLGDLHAQAHHGVEFYTQTKVVVERWPRDWSRKF